MILVFLFLSILLNILHQSYPFQYITSKYINNFNNFRLYDLIDRKNIISNDIKSLGIDFGTSGVRITIVSSNNNKNYIETLLSESKLYETSIQTYDLWINTLNQLLDQIKSNNPNIFNEIQCISLCGTSASCLLFNSNDNSITRGVRMYDYSVVKGESTEYGKRALQLIDDYCPKGSAANSPTSTLAKVLSWNFDKPIEKSERLIHQADYILAYLLYGSNLNNNQIYSDWHNALKLGYDVTNLNYPEWLLKLLSDNSINYEYFLPKVVEPGQIVGEISKELINKYGFNSNCKIAAGTTDSIAAFIATGVNKPGQAVTSLGSTVAIKLISSVKIEDSLRGIYSHRLMSDKNSTNCLWLVGGASNVGCAILRKENFTTEELIELSSNINPQIDSKLDYYPLCNIGERFPINDPNKLPILDPKPITRQEYLHGILQGIARVEVTGYNALKELGATTLTEVLSCGGGAKNNMWTKMRERYLQVPTRKADNVEASFGCALLAKRNIL